MANLTFRRTHQLGLTTARERMQRLADEMTRDYRVKSRWEGDALVFSRPGVKGQVTVTADAIELDARLGPLLGAFAPRIEEQLNKNFDAYFA